MHCDYTELISKGGSSVTFYSYIIIMR